MELPLDNRLSIGIQTSTAHRAGDEAVAPDGRRAAGLVRWSMIAATIRLGRRPYRLRGRDPRPAFAIGAGRGCQPPADARPQMSTSCRCAIRHRSPSRSRPSTICARPLISGSASVANSEGIRGLRRAARRARPAFRRRSRCCGGCGAAPGELRRRYFGQFTEVAMQTAGAPAGGPPIWCGGRRRRVARAGRLADGWISYVVTPETYARRSARSPAAAETAGRWMERFGTGHLLFARSMTATSGRSTPRRRA